MWMQFVAVVWPRHNLFVLKLRVCVISPLYLLRAFSPEHAAHVINVPYRRCHCNRPTTGPERDSGEGTGGKKDEKRQLEGLVLVQGDTASRKKKKKRRRLAEKEKKRATWRPGMG